MKTTTRRIAAIAAITAILLANCSEARACGCLHHFFGAIEPAIAAVAGLAAMVLFISLFPELIPAVLSSVEEAIVAGFNALGTESLDVWTLNQFIRGKIIENELAQIEYSEAAGWYRCGQEFGGTGETFDFNSGTQLVSLKTTDSINSLSKLMAHIDAIATSINELSVEVGPQLSPGEAMEGILDIRIPPGQLALQQELEQLIAYGDKQGVQVIIREFAAGVIPGQFPL